MSSLPANRNALWDRVLVDTLVAAGVRRVLLCPGGRNGLLAMTLQRTPGVECILHVDERSAAFVALGMIAADGQPTAVCTTSGSAVANLLPAMAEADARGLPLVLLTCDRPLAGRLRGEPQTLPQARLCAPLARAQVALPDPVDGTVSLPELQERVLAALVDGLTGDDQGPVHINVPQWGGYCATEEDPAPPEVVVPAPRAPVTRATPVEDVIAIVRALDAGPLARGVVLACADQPLSPDLLEALLEATGYPLIADVASGLRHRTGPGLITTADALAEGAALPLEEADLLIRLGEAPVSPGLTRAVRRMRCPTLRVARHCPGSDFLSPDALGLSPSGVAPLVQLLARGDAGWARHWQALEDVAAATREIVLATAPWGEMAAVARLCSAAGFDALHCANSTSIRLAGLLMPAGQHALRTFAARGVNGTDGTLGLVLGEALAGAGRMLALIGDQAFVHDLPALASPYWRDVRGALCVMNNAGAGLFDLTAARRIEGYAATMRNAPEVDFAGVAQAFGLLHRPCADPDTLDAALAEAAAGTRLSLIEIQVQPDTPARDLPRLVSAMSASARAVQTVEA